MRRPRFKPDDRPLFYHLYNRVAGEPEFLPFGPKEKERFVQLLHQLDLFFTVKVVAYQVMSNHFHLVVQAPKELPTPEEICRRYKAYYGGRRILTPSDPRCAKLGQRMRDISWYMQMLEQKFSRWYNRTRKTRRRGSLWAERFKHTLLGDAQAVWSCCKYVEMNSVRANRVLNPADYRFSSYGAWCGRGRHPFEAHVREILLPFLAGVYPVQTPAELREAFRIAFAGIVAQPANADGQVAPFTADLDRKVRYWVDGLVIGSELFVQDMIIQSRGILRARTRGLSRTKATPLCCYKQLRAI